MKHALNVTAVLMAIFVTAQIVGLGIVMSYIDVTATRETGTTTFNGLPFNLERPQVEESVSYIYILVAIIIGTLLLLLLIKFRSIGLWKLWYFLAVAGTLTVALGSLLPQAFALGFACVLALYKIFRPNFYIHNLSEILIYGGLAAIFSPILNVFSAVMLLLVISAYDIYAVWKSKHMVRMAEFQAESKLFAGLVVPYKTENKDGKKSGDKNSTEKGTIQAKIEAADLSNDHKHKTGAKTAILGGGDIGFPLIFAAVVMKSLINNGVDMALSFGMAMVVVLFSAIALFILFYKSEKGKFYPAMPFISAGCFIGWILVWLIVNFSFGMVVPII